MPPQERAAAVRGGVAAVEAGHRALAQPALALGAPGAQLAHRSAIPPLQEGMSALAAQQRAAADVAGGVLIHPGGPDIPGSHG